MEAAKGLRDFARTNPLLVIKGGVLDGKALSAAEVGKIADLESRDVLLAKLAGALKALPTRAAGLFQAPLSQMARAGQGAGGEEAGRRRARTRRGRCRRPAPAADDPAAENVDAAADTPAEPAE